MLFRYGAVVTFHMQPVESLRAYFERLLERPSFRRVLEEARPYFEMFPYPDKMPARFL